MFRGGHCCLIAVVGVLSVLLGSFLHLRLPTVLFSEPHHSTCWGKIFRSIFANCRTVDSDLAESAAGCSTAIKKSNAHWGQDSPEGKGMCGRWWKKRAEMAATYIPDHSVHLVQKKIIILPVFR